MCVEVATARLRLLRQQLGHKPRQKQHFLCEITTDDIGSAGVGPTSWMFTQDIGLVLGSFPSRFPFPVFLDTLSNAERGDLADQRQR